MVPSRVLPTDLHRRQLTTPAAALSCLYRDDDGIRSEMAGPSLLLVHGAQIHAGTWLPMLQHLPVATALLAPDLRAHGRSERGAPVGIAEWADDLEAVLDSFGATRVHVVGHSMGAAIAIELAARRPEQVLSVVTLGGAFLPAPDADAEVLDAIRIDGAMPTLRRVMNEVVLPKSATDAVRMAALASLSENDDATASAIQVAANQTDVRPQIDAIQCRLTVISGDQDAMCPVEEAQWMADATNSMLHLIPGVGHLPQLEAPEAVAGHVWASISSTALRGNTE